MSLAFGHLIGAWIVGEIIQKISNKNLIKDSKNNIIIYYLTLLLNDRIGD